MVWEVTKFTVETLKKGTSSSLPSFNWFALKSPVVWAYIRVKDVHFGTHDCVFVCPIKAY